MTHDPTTVAATFVLYFVMVLGLGLLAYARTRSLEDYLLGGRSMGSWVTALSAQASDMSGWLLLGLPGLAYAAGAHAGWMVLGLVLGTYLNWKYLAPALRQATGSDPTVLTLPDYFARRFDDESGILRVLCAVVILLFFTIYTGSGLVAGAKLFQTVFGLPYAWAVGVGGAAILLYTLVGGFLAVSWTDVLQGSLMIFALVAAAVGGIVAAGGPAATLSTLRQQQAGILDPFRGIAGRSVGWIGVVSLLGWGLGYFGQPHILARFMAIRRRGLIGRSRRIAMTWVVVCLLAAWGVGVSGAAHEGLPALSGPDTEKVFLHLTAVLFHPAVAGVLLAAVLAAIMSTADSQLLVASSAVAEDLYRGLIRPEAPRRELLWVGRLAVLATALFAFALALNPESMVLGLVAYAWAGFGASFGPPLLLALFWSGTNRYGAGAGLVVGGLTVLFWHAADGGIFELYEIVPGFAAAGAAVVLGSWVGGRLEGG